ncbi:hypothetical protein T03_1184 [Trichinella britovi]|uniref:Uncharacterized protein n=1 Tax=Trichinella britovi TaxID=45882 RepID=A0A0V0Z1G7_TRIBR|nr:hypothetical protein T03_1184 [Trichinella britovi]
MLIIQRVLLLNHLHLFNRVEGTDNGILRINR